jgi:hypothetical protein
LTQLLALLSAPLRDLVVGIDARIEQLEEGGDRTGAAVAPVTNAEEVEQVVAEAVAPEALAEEEAGEADAPAAAETEDSNETKEEE